MRRSPFRSRTVRFHTAACALSMLALAACSGGENATASDPMVRMEPANAAATHSSSSSSSVTGVLTDASIAAPTTTVAPTTTTLPPTTTPPAVTAPAGAPSFVQAAQFALDIARGLNDGTEVSAHAADEETAAAMVAAGLAGPELVGATEALDTTFGDGSAGEATACQMGDITLICAVTLTTPDGHTARAEVSMRYTDRIQVVGVRLGPINPPPTATAEAVPCTGTAADGAGYRIDVSAGGIDCAAAQDLFAQYRATPPETRQGSGMYASVGPWTCSINGLEMAHRLGYDSSCRNGESIITLAYTD